MDIYFCDECAARVTAADLRRGFGIRKSDVVVCGSCVEEGRGAERLERAHSARPALVAAGGPDEVHDRAATEPDGGPDESAPAREYFDNVSLEDDTDLLAQAQNDQRAASSDSSGLSAMATGLGALSPSSQVVGDDVDDLDDSVRERDNDKTEEMEPQKISDDLDLMAADRAAAEAEAEAEAQAAADRKSPDQAAEAAEQNDSGDDLDPTDLAPDMSSGKADTEELPASGSSVAEGVGSKRGARNGSTTKRKGGGRGSSKATRSKSSSGSGRQSTRSERPGSGSTKRSGSKAISTKRVRAVKKSNATLIYGVSFVTIGILLIAIIVLALREPADPGHGTVIDPSRELSDEVHRTYQTVQSRLSSDNPTELKAALAELDTLRSAMESWEVKAKEQGLTDEEMGRILNGMKYFQLQTMRRTISDKLMEVEAQQGL